MNIILYVGALVVGFVLLVKGSDYFVDGAAGVATKLGIPQLVIGLTIVAMGTSAPEAAVSITAAVTGNADITIGNIVGSNILNVLIILGIASVIVPITVAKSTIKIDIPFMLGCSVLLIILGLDGNIGLLDGIVFWAFFIAYLSYLFINSRKNKENTDDESSREIKLIKQLAFITGGLIAIIAGSKFAVYGATEIARAVGISERFIGLTVVALGTSLPELFTSVNAARKGNADIAIGNIVGSNIFNILFIVGTTAFVRQVPFDPKFIVDSVVMVVAGIILWAAVLKKEKLTRTGGIVMLLAYLSYFVYLCMKP